MKVDFPSTSQIINEGWSLYESYVFKYHNASFRLCNSVSKGEFALVEELLEGHLDGAKVDII